MALRITNSTVFRAQEIVLAYPKLSAWDAVHIALMEAERVNRILAFDCGFDAYPGIHRVPAVGE